MSEWWENTFYSQFGEDSVVFSYFRNKNFARTRRLDELDLGYYVDIGAHHPYMISNTWYFYKRGWRGINVDPTPGVMANFEKFRPEDINLSIAISDADGFADFYSYGPAVDNTMDPSKVDFSKNPEKITVETMRLDTLLDRYLPEQKAIDVMSVDVEGLDLRVMQSNNWSKYRPEIVIVEWHGDSVNRLLHSELYASMLSWNYNLYAWTPPSLIFRRY